MPERVPIEYTVVENRRAKRIIVSVRPGGVVRVTIPHKRFVGQAAKLVLQQKEWILKAVEKFRTVSVVPRVSPTSKRADYLKDKEVARRLATARLAHFNAHYNFNIGRIAIKNQSSRWGSCSKKGNLNFNYKIALLPPHLADYIIVHELCHLGQLNHSPKFWALVSEAVPNYKTARKELRSKTA